MNNKIVILVILFCSLYINNAFSQTDPIDSLLDKILFEDNDGYIEILDNTSKFQFLYSRINYDSNTFFAGRDIGVNQYNMTGQIAYFNSIGINLGAAAAYYSAIDPRISTILLMAGYSGKFTKSSDYRYRVSYSRYIFPQSNVLAESSFNSGITGGITIDKKIAGTRLDYTLLMGNKTNSQLSWDLYKNITILKFGKLNRIRFEPEVSLYFGNDKTIITQVGVIPGRIPQEYTFEVEKVKFGLMNTELKLPFTVSCRNLDFEIGYNINFPRSIVSGENLKSTSYFNFSIGYAISL